MFRRGGQGVSAIFSALGVFLLAECAAADITIFKSKDWEFYTTGRVGAFLGYARGDGFPPNGTGPNGETIEVTGGVGLDNVNADVDQLVDDQGNQVAGNIESVRVRTGFVTNILGFGAVRQLTPDTTLLTYMSLATIIESSDRRKFLPALPDFRQGYLKMEGPWGSFLAGRELTLFDRGATEITFLYGYNYALGYPGSVDISGPAAGHIGFGVLANGFAAGMVYATPDLAGFRLNVGIYDPSGLVGSRWTRTRLPRPEGELTYDVPFGPSTRAHLFVNGTWQELFATGSPDKTSAVGVGFGGRFEAGPVHLGLGGHRGRGLGVSYALEPSAATYATPQQQNTLRDTDGYIAQLQLRLGRFDVQGGAGITRVFLLEGDRRDLANDDGDAATPAGDDDDDPNTLDPVRTGVFVPKSQVGYSGGLIYHVDDGLHLGLDVFRAEINWFDSAFSGVATSAPEQNLWFVNAGITSEW